MNTKADEHRRLQEQQRARENTRRRKPRRRVKRDARAREHMRTTRNHNIGRRAGKNAVVELEDSPRGQRPPRKSTRKTQNRTKSSEVLERMRQTDAMRPQTRVQHDRTRSRKRKPKSPNSGRANNTRRSQKRGVA